MKCEDIEASTNGNPYMSLFLRHVHVQQGARFVIFPVTKPVVTKSTMRCQMKDMDIIFALIPQSFSGLDTSATQSLAFFSKSFKCYWPNLRIKETQLLENFFFKWLRFLDKSRYVLT